jgi:hypothetical protein
VHFQGVLNVARDAAPPLASSLVFPAIPKHELRAVWLWCSFLNTLPFNFDQISQVRQVIFFKPCNSLECTCTATQILSMGSEQRSDKTHLVKKERKSCLK